MPRARFSNIIRGYRGEAAKTKYLDHLRGVGQGENIGTRGNRPDTVALYLTPFGLPLGTELVVQASALQPSYNLFSSVSALTSRIKNAPGTDTPIKLRSYSAPRVVRRQLSSATGTVKTSKLTGLKYLGYNTESASVPFGKKTGDTAVLAAYTEIVTQAKGTSTNLKFSLVEERV